MSLVLTHGTYSVPGELPKTTSLLGTFQPPDFQMELGLLKAAENQVRQSSYLYPPALWDFPSGPAGREELLFTVVSVDGCGCL